MPDVDDDDSLPKFDFEEEEYWRERARKLRTPDGIRELLAEDRYSPHGPRNPTWHSVLEAAIEDAAAQTFALVEQHDRFHWHRALWVFTWPLVEATTDEATSPCLVRVWVSPNVPESYKALHEPAGGIDVADLGVRMTTLRACDTAEPWNTYAVQLLRSSEDKYTYDDSAWWQSRPADHFTKPEAIVSALARTFPAKGWSLAPRRY